MRVGAALREGPVAAELSAALRASGVPFEGSNAGLLQVPLSSVTKSAVPPLIEAARARSLAR